MKAAIYHFFSQRFTGILLIPLGLWFLISIKRLDLLDINSLEVWFKSIHVSILLILLVGCLFYHSLLGIHMILEDYISDKKLQGNVIKIINILYIISGNITALFILTLLFIGIPK